MSKTMEVQNKKYVQSDEIADIANKVIQKESSTLELGEDESSKARIGYILVYPEISKGTAGRCIRCNNEMKFFSEYDYLIEMSGKLWDALTEEIKYLLTYHELLHVFVDYKKDGTPQYKMRDHDIQDFSVIVQNYGINWLHDIKSTANSLLEDDEDDFTRIKL